MQNFKPGNPFFWFVYAIIISLIGGFTNSDHVGLDIALIAFYGCYGSVRPVPLHRQHSYERLNTLFVVAVLWVFIAGIIVYALWQGTMGLIAWTQILLGCSLFSVIRYYMRNPGKSQKNPKEKPATGFEQQYSSAPQSPSHGTFLPHP